jgi:hypothetical protein
VDKETLESLKEELYNAHMEEASFLNSDDEQKRKEIKDKIKEIRRKIAKHKFEKISDEQRLEKLKQELEDAHFDELRYKNNPEEYAKTRERIKKLRKEIAKLKVNEMERGNIL